MLEDYINTYHRDIVHKNIDWIYLGKDWLHLTTRLVKKCDVYKNNREFTRIPFFQGTTLRHWISSLRRFEIMTSVHFHSSRVPQRNLEAENILSFQNVGSRLSRDKASQRRRKESSNQRQKRIQIPKKLTTGTSVGPPLTGRIEATETAFHDEEINPLL
jgi:hypothetical protein